MRRGILWVIVALLLSGPALAAFHEFSIMESVAELREEGNYAASRAILEKFKGSIAGKILMMIPAVNRQMEFEEAMLLIFSGEYQKAKETLEYLLAQESDSERRARLHFALGNLALVTDNDWERAKDQYQLALEADEHHERARINLELLLREIEEERQAREALDKEGQENKEGKEDKQRGSGRKRSLLESKELWGGSKPPSGPTGPRY